MHAILSMDSEAQERAFDPPPMGDLSLARDFLTSQGNG